MRSESSPVSETGLAAGAKEAEPLDFCTWLLVGLLGGGLYAVTFGLGLFVLQPDERISLVWPVSGLGLMMAYRWGRPAVLLVALLAFLLAGYAFASWQVALFFALGYGGAAFIGADLLRRSAFNPSLERIRDVLFFILCGVVLAPIWSAGWVGTITHFDAVGGRGQSWLSDLAHGWLADAIGVITLGPILFVWSARTHINWRNRQLAEVSVWLLILLALEALVFLNWAPSETLRYPLELAIFPVLLWSAVRFGQRGASVGVLATAMLASVSIIYREGAVSPLYLWVFIGVVALTTIMLAAVFTEYRLREDEIRMNEERLRAFVRAIPDLAFVISEDGWYLDVFAPRASIFSERAQMLKGRRLQDIYPEGLNTQFIRVIQEVLQSGEVRVWRYVMDFKGTPHWFEGRVAPMEALEGHPRSVFWVAYDITESQRATAALRERDRLLQSVTEAEAALLKTRDYQLGVIRTLEIIGKGMGLDRIQLYLRSSSAGSDTLRPEFVWNHDPVLPSGPAEGGPSHGWVLHEAEFRGPWGTLASGGTWSLRNRTDGPAKISAHLPPEVSLSALWVPIFVEDTFAGAIEFSIYRDIGEWNDNVRAVLHSLAGSLGGFIETKRIEDALKEAKRLADAANNAKSDFLAMMSHEIRTPMNAILGFADLLEQSQLSTDQAEYAGIISRSGHDLLELINHILDFSKLESGPIQLEQVPFNFETTVMEVLEIMLMKAREKGLELTYDMPEDSCLVYRGDPLRTRQILLNLVSNAVKFTQQGRVAVRVRAEPLEGRRHRVHVAVEDTGIGIPADRLDDLFKAFTQLDSSTTREFGGTGLGLTICQRLAEKMDGRIWGESVLGKGSTFHVEIHLESGEDASEAPRVNGSRPQLDAGFAEAHPLRLLVAEDDARNTRLISEVLTQLGYAPVLVSDGEAAARELEGTRFDAVLLDIHMAHRDGVTLARQLRAGTLGTLNASTHLIALTASVSLEDQRRCQQAGIDAFLGKPFALSDLLRELRDAQEAVGCRPAPAAPAAGDEPRV